MSWIRSNPLLVAAAAILLLLLLGLGILLRFQQGLRQDLRAVRQQLSATSLHQQNQTMAALRQERQALLDELDSVQQRLAKLAGHPVLAPSQRLSPAAGEDRINYKVALFDARHRIMDLAERKGVWVPEDLGIRDRLEEGENTESRLWQLASVVVLVEAALAFGLEDFDAIKAGPPVVIQRPEHALNYLEYPVMFRFRCTYEEWTRWQEYLDAEGLPLAIRSVSMRNVGTLVPPRLEVTATYAGARLLDAQQVAPGTSPRVETGS